MNIVIGGHTSYPRGSAGASRVRHIARGLAELGHRVRVFAMSPQPAELGTAARWYEEDGIAYFPAAGELPAGGNRTLKQKLRTQYLMLHRAQTVVINEMEALRRTEGVDVFIGYTGGHFGLQRVLRFCRRRRIPVVRDVVEYWEASYFPMGRLNPIFWNTVLNMRVALPRSDGIIAISKSIASRFESRGMPILRVPAIIDVQRWMDTSAAELGPRDGPFQFTYLGNAHYRDAPLLLAQAFQEVLNQGHDAFLNFVGCAAGAGFAGPVSAWVGARPKLQERVKFWGRVSDAEVRARLHASDALVFPRISGTTANAAFPTRLPEYLMTGRPVVATAISDIPEYLRDGQEVVLVEPDSVESMAGGMVRLLRMPDRGRELGAAGRQKCISCFDYRKRCAEISTFLEQIVARGQAQRR